MIMETKKNRQIFLILVPHRDTRLELAKFYDALVKDGLKGVYSFPFVAPLASLSQALNADELKHFARSLRLSTKGDKISAAETTITTFPTGAEDMALFGPQLNLQTLSGIGNESSVKKIINYISPIVLGACLLPKSFNQKFDTPPIQEGLSFRAAAVTNMYWRPLKNNGEIIYKWKIGKLCWLPKHVNQPGA